MRSVEIRTAVPVEIAKGVTALFTSFDGLSDPEEHIALQFGNWQEQDAPLVRVHSECLTGDVFGSARCDCGSQLQETIDRMAAEGGILLYMRQEGRGIGLYNKLDAYRLQGEQGLDTYAANRHLGFGDDLRDYCAAAEMLQALGASRIRLLSNNPDKAVQLERYGIDIAAQISTGCHIHDGNRGYLRSKITKKGHRLSETAISPAEDIIEEMRRGRMVILVDDEDRENEGDLVIAADCVTPETINFMATHGRGLICLAMDETMIDRLKLSPMVSENGTKHQTAFTVSIEAKRGVSTGISAFDRAHTIKTAIDPRVSAVDIVTPGHVFPLRARPGGVLERAGHTEAATDLAALAGFSPAGAICEIMRDDGQMARLPDLIRFAEKHKMKIGTIADLIAYRMGAASKIAAE